MIEDFIVDPVLGARVIFGEVMDEFQKVRLKTYWWVPRVIDSSGFSSFKTRTLFIYQNLRCLLIPDHVAGVYYQNFNVGQKSFWGYYDLFKRRSAIFRVQIGQMAADMSETEGKGTTKGPSCWNCYYKNASHIMLPAPGFLTDARNQASIRLNDLDVDEYTKIDATGSTGIDDQLLGRCTRETFNQNHPFWCNHQIFTATAEDTMHPAYERYATFLKEAKRGNPDYAVISFNFKDMSDLPSYSGKSFRAALREVKVLKDMKAKHSKSKFLQEGLGIWSRNGRRWYDSECIDKCVELGRKRDLVPLINRREYKGDGEKVRYFLGVDPAKGDGKKSDDGALVCLRAEPLVEEAGDNLADWKLDYVWAYKVRKADASQWSALVHLKEKHFQFSGICMDHGGGGIWIKPELAKAKQIIHDVAVKVLPIVTPDDTSVIHGNYCLIMFNRGDESICRKWDSLKGEDNLIDAAHCEMHEAIEHTAFAFPRPFNEWPKEETDKWPEEKVWANKLLDLTRKQLASIAVLTDDQGNYVFTKNNAHQFEAKGRKDFAYAAIHAFVRFLVWLKFSELDYLPKEEDACMGE